MSQSKSRSQPHWNAGKPEGAVEKYRNQMYIWAYLTWILGEGEDQIDRWVDSSSHPSRQSCLLPAQVLYQRPGSLRVLCRILTVPSNTLLDRGLRCSWFLLEPPIQLEVTVPNSHHCCPHTPLHIFTSSSFSPSYFSSFSCSFFLMLPSLGMSTSTTTVVWLAITSLSVWIWKSNRTLTRSFSITFEGVSHLNPGTSSP